MCSGILDGRSTFGVVVGDEFVDLSKAYESDFALVAALMDPDSVLKMAESRGVACSLDLLELRCPIVRPGKIICVGTNYADHVAESDSVTEAPGYPMLFTRFAESLVGHGHPIVRPVNSSQFDYEGELAIVIGRETRSVSTAEAMGAVAGYAPFMDGTLRDFQRHTKQFTPGKNFDDSGSWGPYLVSADEVANPHDIQLITTLNGEVMQSASTSQLIYGMAQIISYVSSFTTLIPGDVIATGTPGGVGYARTPPVLLVPGDTVRVEIESVGALQNTVVENTVVDAT